MRKPNQTELILTIAMTLVVFLFNILPPLFTGLPLWPMFLSVAFFFLIAHGDIKKIPSVLVSGVAGIAIAWGMFSGMEGLTPLLGERYALWICLGIALALIIVGGTALPFALNNITFAYLIMGAAELVSGLHINGLEAVMSLPGHASYNMLAEAATWAAVNLVGGVLMCLGCGLTMRGVLKKFGANAHT
ncbi:MAG: DUF1097 family protein [Clostridiales Family XIII bacterium]|jgi:hypothetical protein|nr:DUF1097 family protein [Clostridiales Family XIII bacterium]